MKTERNKIGKKNKKIGRLYHQS